MLLAQQICTRCIDSALRPCGSHRWQMIAASPPTINIEVRAGLARLFDPPEMHGTHFRE
jgi:hypothetical protein